MAKAIPHTTFIVSNRTIPDFLLYPRSQPLIHISEPDSSQTCYCGFLMFPSHNKKEQLFDTTFSSLYVVQLIVLRAMGSSCFSIAAFARTERGGGEDSSRQANAAWYETCHMCTDVRTDGLTNEQRRSHTSYLLRQQKAFRYYNVVVHLHCIECTVRSS